jgi:hypothetical protein
MRMLQHFATKLWNITNFVMLFQAVMKFLSRLVEFKMLVNWGIGPLTNEIASFVINYSNKALSNQRPVPKSGNYPRDLNKDYASNSQTFSRALRRE